MDRVIDKNHNQATLRSLDMVAWRVQRAKTARHQNEVHRTLNERPRLRRETRH